MYKVRVDLSMHDSTSPKKSPDEVFEPLQGLSLSDMFEAFCPACDRNMNKVKWFCGEAGGWAVFVDGKKMIITDSPS